MPVGRENQEVEPVPVAEMVEDGTLVREQNGFEVTGTAIDRARPDEAAASQTLYSLHEQVMLDGHAERTQAG